jgi:hypothetical protein
MIYIQNHSLFPLIQTRLGRLPFRLNTSSHFATSRDETAIEFHGSRIEPGSVVVGIYTFIDKSHLSFAHFKRTRRIPGMISFPSLSRAGLMSNAHRIREILMNNELRARWIPGQDLRPNPKGRSKFLRRGSVVSRKRSGLNSSGSGNISAGKKKTVHGRVPSVKFWYFTYLDPS